MGVDRLRTLDIQLNFFANHHFGQRRFACTSSFNCADVFALTQNSHAIRDFQNLVQFVGNDDDGFSVFAHIAHDVKQFFRLLRRKHSSRFVQNQNLRAAIEHFNDLKRLLLADAHFVYLLVKIDIEGIALTDGMRFLTDCFEIVFFMPIHHKRNVFRGGEYVDEFEVLMNHADA